MPTRRREFKTGEVEGRRHSAADQRPTTERARCLPHAARYDDLRRLAQPEIAAEPEMMNGMAIIAHREFQSGARIMMPDLVGIDFVPVRAFARLEQEEDRGAGATARIRRPEGLAKMPAFGMRPQPEAGNDFVRRH